MAGIIPTVLVVEDEDVVRSVLEHMLIKLGCRVMSTANGREAVNMLIEQASQIDLVIFDFMMPFMNGPELFTQIKKLAPHVKTLLTTGHGEIDEVDELQSHGLDGLLRKPFTFSQIREVVTGVLSGHRDSDRVALGC